MVAPELRQRRNKANKKDKPSEDKKKADEDKKTDEDKKKSNRRTKTARNQAANDIPEPDESWISIFRSHWSFPFYCILAAAFVVRRIHSFWFWYLGLRHSEWILNSPWAGSWMKTLVRPSLSWEESRQTLIVGALCDARLDHNFDSRHRSFSTWLSLLLRLSPEDSLKSLWWSKLFHGLEIGYDNSDSSWFFVRDGTISWFHGIRFFKPLTNSPQDDYNQRVIQSWTDLCFQYIPMENRTSIGFHPRMFRSDHSCNPNTWSFFTKDEWSACWAKQCLAILQQEWGCAWKQPSSCITPFVTTLHQVRHPLDAITHLVTMNCLNGNKSLYESETLHPSFAAMANALFFTKSFPLKHEEEEEGEPETQYHNFSSYTCLEGTTWYWLEYTHSMQIALRSGLIQQFYKMEKTTPCQVLEMAGFLNPNKAVFFRQQLVDACHNQTSGPQHLPIAAAPMPKKNSFFSNSTIEDWSLTWTDFQGVGNPKELRALLELVRHLALELGYETKDLKKPKHESQSTI